MQSINAKRRHVWATNRMPGLERTANGWHAVACVLTGLFLLFGVLTFIDPAIPALYLPLLISGGVTLPFAEYVHRLGLKHSIDGYYSKAVTKTYRDLLPHNQELARPLVETIYRIEKTNSHDSMEQINKRKEVLGKIVTKDTRERSARALPHGDEDIKAVEAVLSGYDVLAQKELT